MSDPLRVTVWNEFRHERERDDVKVVYPDGIHAALAEGLAASDLRIRTATLDEPEHGLTEAVLDETDVLTWWGHMAHKEVEDEIVPTVMIDIFNMPPGDARFLVFGSPIGSDQPGRPGRLAGTDQCRRAFGLNVLPVNQAWRAGRPGLCAFGI